MTPLNAGDAGSVDNDFAAEKNLFKAVVNPIFSSPKISNSRFAYSTAAPWDSKSEVACCNDDSKKLSY